jgi:hypothetical protein
LPPRDKVLAFGVDLNYFVLVFSGSDLFVMIGRDKDATSEPGEPRIDAAVGTATVTNSGHQVARLDRLVKRLEEASLKLSDYTRALPDAPADAEASSLPTASASAPAASPAPPEWARATTRRLRDERKLPKGIRPVHLARLLAIESQRAVKAGQLRRAWKASYLENQLKAWGIWPLSSLK